MRKLFVHDDDNARDAITFDELSELYRHPVGGAHGWLRMNFVTTLDGSVQGQDGRSGTINTASDHQIFALQRAHCDAVVAGAQTIRMEGYRAIDLADWQRDLRQAEGLAEMPALVIISGSLRLDPAIAEAADGRGGPVIIVTVPGHPSSATRPLRLAGIEVIEIDEMTAGTGVDLDQVLTMLATRGYRRLLCEGGAHLHHGLLQADLVDELCLTCSPMVLSGSGMRLAAGSVLEPAAGFDPCHVLLGADGALFTRYLRSRNVQVRR